MQSPFSVPRQDPLHVAIIMDGSGRWATRRGLPREAGHRAGAQAVRRVVEAARRLGVGTLTLFAFSGDNWHRAEQEVNHLLRLFEEFLQGEKKQWAADGTRLSVIGRRDRFPPSLRAAAAAAEATTAGKHGMHLRLALDYSGRDAILRAATRLPTGQAATREEFAQLLGEATNGGAVAPDVDLLIRSGGEQRLSDFLLWEIAYAEMVFTDRMWPDFDAADLEAALQEYYRRDRRFGRVPAAASS